MRKSDTGNKTTAVLRALGYTPKTLSADIGVSVNQARRILSEGGTIFTNEFFEICRATGMEPNILAGLKKPGTFRGTEATA